MNRRTDGSKYEQIAGEYLEKQGIKIIHYNFRCHYGEIDLIGQSENFLIFFEVKHRTNSNYGYAQEAVGIRKQRIISRVSDYFRITSKQYSGLQTRYDVIAVNGQDISWFKNAFSYCGNAY